MTNGQMTNQQAAADRIARLNDLARRAMGLACRVMTTPGIRALDPRIQSQIRERVETFDAFEPGDNPYGERDFGAFDCGGNRVYWKIDYYDRSMNYRSEDPGDLLKTNRVLTIMLAEEY